MKVKSRHRQQTIMVQTHQDSCEEGTTTPIPPQETEKIWHGSSDPEKVLQLHHREHWLHHRLVWQLLGLRPQGATEGSVYGPVHHWGQAPCHPGPLYQTVLEEVPKNCHPSYRLFSPLPHGKQYRCAKSGTNRTLNSFYIQTIRLLTSWSGKLLVNYLTICTDPFLTHHIR